MHSFLQHLLYIILCHQVASLLCCKTYIITVTERFDVPYGSFSQNIYPLRISNARDNPSSKIIRSRYTASLWLIRGPLLFKGKICPLDPIRCHVQIRQQPKLYCTCNLRTSNLMNHHGSKRASRSNSTHQWG
jgi:hypothetical protein